MKTLKNLREAVKKERTVYKRKYMGFNIEIIQRYEKFEAYVDGEKLDTYDTKQHAQKMIMQFVREVD
tara:strand:+ start:337 stop:537 length:201 start_codon:yes stop_codon:yes gene_type:complete